MSNELQIVDESVISVEVKAEINEDIDRIITAHKNNRQAINKLVFESVAAMTDADDAQVELSNKGWFKRRLGSITGSNSRLQDRINSNRATAMYASQRTLQKLAEQNLMTFDLIAAVNNKLNASLIKVDEEFANVYQGLAKFFKTNRSELAKLEARIEKIERNINLLNWQSTIEYQEFDGVEYIDLDDISKIACLVRDFYDITKGEWSNYDLLLLKRAMGIIEMTPRTRVNYFDVLKGISYNAKLKGYMLGSRTIGKIDDPSYLLSLGCLKKYEMLNDEESYMVDTVVEQMTSIGVDVKRNTICDQMTVKYLATKAYVDVNVDVECYDLILDLLYNIRQAKDEKLLINNEGFEVDAGDLYGGYEGLEVDAGDLFDKGLKYWEGDGVEQSNVQAYYYFRKAAELGNEYAMGMVGRCYEENKGVERDYVEALEWYNKAANLGNDIAMNDIGDLYYYGNGVTQDYLKALEWYIKAANLENEVALNNIGILYEDGLGVDQDYEKALEWYCKAADLGNGVSANNVGNMYFDARGVALDYEKALEWYHKAVALGNEDALVNIEKVNQEKVKQEEVAKKAMEQYKLGVGAFERGQYKNARKYFSEALQAGLQDAAFSLAEAYYRDSNFSWFDEENKLEYINCNGEMDSDYLNKEDYVIFYLLRNAIAGYRRATLELCGWIMTNYSESTIWRLFRYGMLDDLKEGFVLGITKFGVEKEKLTNYSGKIDGLEDWAYANLIEAAQEGDGAAQYYIGAYYTKKYDLSCSSEHQSKAKYWLAQSEGKVNAPNVYKLTKYLNKFIAFGDCPAIDYFV